MIVYLIFYLFSLNIGDKFVKFSESFAYCGVKFIFHRVVIFGDNFIGNDGPFIA